MLLCEESSSVLDMLRPKVKLVEEACQCEYPSQIQILALLLSPCDAVPHVSQLSGRARSCPVSAGSFWMWATS